MTENKKKETAISLLKKQIEIAKLQIVLRNEFEKGNIDNQLQDEIDRKIDDLSNDLEILEKGGQE